MKSGPAAQPPSTELPESLIVVYWSGRTSSSWAAWYVIESQLLLLLLIMLISLFLLLLYHLRFTVLVLSSLLLFMMLSAFRLVMHVEALHHHHKFYTVWVVYSLNIIQDTIRLEGKIFLWLQQAAVPGGKSGNGPTRPLEIFSSIAIASLLFQLLFLFYNFAYISLS